MPRPLTGSVCQSKLTGLWTIRWMEGGRRPQKSGFRSEADARAWFERYAVAKGLREPAGSGIGEVQAWARRQPQKGVTTWVYVMAAPDVRRIKIGRTTMPGKRLKEIRAGCPMALSALLLMPGTEALESKLLEVTRSYAVPGASREWRTAEALEVVFAYLRERGTHSETPLAHAA